ncbi:MULTISPECIES: class I SAM-dependent methyltransferase [unclassified Nostoc]|uniref:class I SAM-dependent methyltransferase n=1 Tax=unclassified Nostoc TaxID=2593658 RepID=UPI002625A876|nr:class I SAM-dependent methyltransferase [Nostoc sp. S13]MDF5736176.1 methyltransferase domain-containing protein [Nostoc sp. S13]
MNKQAFTHPSVNYKFDEDNFAVEDESLSLKYFEEQIIDSQKYWRRFGGRPDFSGKVVLEIGCGHGALSIDAAISGAQQVIGLDLISDRITFARRIVAERFPDIANKIEFHQLDIDNMTTLDGKVDVIISKDTFEHIMGIDRILVSIKRLLREGGLLITGFSPLYYSPYGDHGFHAIGQPIKLPWAHLILGDARVVAAYNKYHEAVESHSGVECHSVYELGLNKLTRREFLQAFDQAGFAIVSETVNAVQGASKLMPLLRLLNKVPGLEDYTTVNMYVIARKI